MTEKQLKAYIKDKYYLKVRATKGFNQKYYTMSFLYDSGGGTWSPTKTYDDYGDKLANKLFDSISEIIDVLENK